MKQSKEEKQAAKIENIKSEMETKLKVADINRKKKLEEVIKKSKTLTEKKGSSTNVENVAPQGSA